MNAIALIPNSTTRLAPAQAVFWVSIADMAFSLLSRMVKEMAAHKKSV